MSEGLEWDTYVWSRAAGIYGGTAQIQRNIVAQRVLGLPRRKRRTPGHDHAAVSAQRLR